MTDLCIDTSGATTIALVREGEPTLYASNDSARHHAESIAPLIHQVLAEACLLYTSPSPRDRTRSRMPSSA